MFCHWFEDTFENAMYAYFLLDESSVDAEIVYLPMPNAPDVTDIV